MGPDLILIFCIGTLEWTNLISSQHSSAFCYDKRFLYFRSNYLKIFKGFGRDEPLLHWIKILRPFSKAFFYLSILATFFLGGGGEHQSFEISESDRFCRENFDSSQTRSLSSVASDIRRDVFQRETTFPGKKISSLGTEMQIVVSEVLELGRQTRLI